MTKEEVLKLIKDYDISFAEFLKEKSTTSNDTINVKCTPYKLYENYIYYGNLNGNISAHNANTWNDNYYNTNGWCEYMTSYYTMYQENSKTYIMMRIPESTAFCTRNGYYRTSPNYTVYSKSGIDAWMEWYAQFCTCFRPLFEFT